jgi:Tol biopolymer transport system component
MPIRDPALQRLLTSLNASTGQGGQALIDVAWSPNGRVLAAVPEENSTNGGAAPAPVTFYDSATAKTLGTLQPQPSTAVTQSAGAGSFYFLRWSADGSHVLVYSRQLDTITIWGPSVLPRSASA